ncbi:MAG TPA: slipin family protein [Candidatus Methylacidiphilales bacterium]|jgi:regulator of protease activity HflC (stomatin/prohibitin superfamily)|nr:slipin family protein [Candidatus Methylacidiphilales bacterium]
MPDSLSFTPILFIAVVLFLLSGIRIAQQYDRGVVFRLGWFVGIRGPGLYYLIPLIEWQRKIDTRTVTVAVEQQETITRDSVTVKVNAVLWFRVVDPAKAVLSVENYSMAIYQVALTGLRNIIGQHDLDEVLKERDKINGILKASLNELSAPWGTAVEIVEMKDVEIPPNMQRVMAMEAEAIREKRARIIKASAELEASEKLAQAALRMMSTPASLELRRMQMVSEVGAENNSTVVVMIPAEFQALARNLNEQVARQNKREGQPPG